MNKAQPTRVRSSAMSINLVLMLCNIWAQHGRAQHIRRGGLKQKVVIRVRQSWQRGGRRSEVPQSKRAAASSPMETEECLVLLCSDLC